MIKNSIFYVGYREEFGNIKLNKTVSTINSILNYGNKKGLSIPQLAYVLATASHEARHRTYRNDFYPIVERGSWNYIIRKYWYNKRVRGWLGNRSIYDAWKYRGRGLVQLTGYVNYKKFGIENNPSKALDFDTSVRILVDGMMDGSFTGVGLKRFINDAKKDYVKARKVVNGLDKAHDIASIAIDFEQILRASITLDLA